MPSLQLQNDDKLLPTSFALRSMNELRDWVPNEKNKFNISNVSIQPRAKNALKPLLLLTHDMAGGYKEDKNIQGNHYKDIYNVQYWHLTDTFVYFSHERVSIPPVNWTNACHRNGVKCLGTFLVEGNNQMHEMEALLHGPPLYDYNDDDPMRLWSPYYADKLVAIAKHYGFDGWLFNIECEFFPFPTSPKSKAEELAKFMGYFREKLHNEIPGSQLIWYDSMTSDGEIRWQNQLTWKNELFFKNTDGIFLNYWWKKEYPEMSRRVAESIGRSGLDVYFGTDVWGRHTYGGGGFKSYKGVQTAYSANTSSALFGMAWTYEHFDKSEFEKMDTLFWCGGEYSDYPPPPPKNPDDKKEVGSDDSEDEIMHGRRKGISDTVECMHAPGTDWFVTTFDRGFGNRFYYRGKKLLSQPWSHLSHQSILPNEIYRTPKIHPADENIKMTCSLDCDYGAFLGGTSLVIKGQRLNHRESRDVETEINISLYKLSLDASKGCSLRYTYRTLLMNEVKLAVSCHFSLKTNDSANFFKVWQPHGSLPFEFDEGVRATVTTQDSSDESRCLLLPTTEEVKEENDWITKTIDVPAVPEGGELYINRLEVSVVIDTAGLVGLTNHVIACLGYISIIPTTTQVEVEPSSIIQDLFWDNCKHIKVEGGSLSDIDQEEVHKYYGTLNWTNAANIANSWQKTDYHNIFYQESDEPTTRIFLGTAFCNQFRISGLNTIRTKSPKIIVEAVNREGYIFSSANIDLVFN